MAQHERAVTGQPHVEFDPGAAERLGAPQPGQRVFRRARRRAAMADHRRASGGQGGRGPDVRARVICAPVRRRRPAPRGSRLPSARGRAQILAGLLVDLAHAELDLAAVVEAEHLDLDRSRRS